MKLKIKPSAKIKRRYLLIDSSKKDVEKAILDYIGILGWAKASPVFVKSKPLILSIDRSALVNVRAAFEASSSKILVKKVSGTIKGLN
jgi:RNase P/RNase MRP subunit POP5